MLLSLVPLLPLLSGVLLIFAGGRLPRTVIAMLGAGSVGASAFCVFLATTTFLADGQPQHITYWTWMAVGDFAPGIAFYIDGLTVVMMSGHGSIETAVRSIKLGAYDYVKSPFRWKTSPSGFAMRWISIGLGGKILIHVRKAGGASG